MTPSRGSWILTLIFFLLGLAILPTAVALVLSWAAPGRTHNEWIFDLVCLGALLGWLSLFVLWTQRGYERRWQQFRARSWQRTVGRFDDGEIVAMRRGGSETISGYQVWLGYDYLADGDQTGLYALPFVGEFPNEEIAEEYRKRAANHNVVVRVSPRSPQRSCVFDEDVRLLIGDQS